MKIVRLETLGMGAAWRTLTFVRLTTDEGLTGVSETRIPNRTGGLRGYLDEAAPRYVIGADPFEIERLVQRMAHLDYGRVGEIVAAAIALVEIACWDIVGKATGQPVYRLLGGAVRDSIPAYANGWYTVERTPEAFADAARRVVARGYRALKFDPFGVGFYEMDRAQVRHAIELVEAVRQAVGPDVELLIEMHGRFSPAMAVRIARELERFEPSWVEEPTPPDNLAAFARAARQIAIPVAAGERLHHKFEFRELFERQAVDIIQPDITECCGLLETKKIAAMADMYYMLVAPHNVGGPVSTATALHLAACTTNFKIQEHFNDFAESWVKQAAAGCPEVIDGCFSLPHGPGLGVELNDDVIQAHPPAAGHFNLWADDWHKRRLSGPG